MRRGLIQLAWRFLLFQKDSDLVQWFRSRTEGAKGALKTKMIVALARKLLIALWRMVTTGEVPRGVVLRSGLNRRQEVQAQSCGTSGDVDTHGWSLTIRGGGDPSRNMVIEPFVRMGPPPRSLAAEANDCFMVRTRRVQPNTRLRREISRATAGSPRIIQTAQPAGASGEAVTPT